MTTFHALRITTPCTRTATIRTKVASTATRRIRTAGGNLDTTIHSTSTNTPCGDHMFRNEVISPTVPFTHPDIQSTDQDCITNSTHATGHYPHNEEVPGQRSNPDCTEQENVSLNGAVDASGASDAIGQNQIYAPDTGVDARDTHDTEEAPPLMAFLTQMARLTQMNKTEMAHLTQELK